MARIYSSRVLIDPSLLSTVGRATEDRIRMENERRRNAVAPFSNLFSKLGSEIDNYRARKAEEDKQAKRYADVSWQSSQEQMADPMYRAALDEYSRTGSAQPITSYMLSRETAEANRLERARAAAEKADIDRRNKEAEASAAYPSYLEAITKSIEANKNGNKKEALIYSEQASALQKKYGFTDAALTGLFEAEEAERELAEARAEEEEYQKEQAKKKAMKSREMRDFVEVNFIPTNMKNAEDKQYSNRIVNSVRNTLTDEDYNYLTDLISGKKTTADIVAESIQNAIATYAAQNTTEALAEKKKLEAILEKVKQDFPLSPDEQSTYDKYAKTGSTPKPKPSTPTPTPTPKPKPSTPETPELARIRQKEKDGVPLSPREQAILDNAGGK